MCRIIEKRNVCEKHRAFRTSRGNMKKYIYKEHCSHTIPVFSPDGFDCFVTDGFDAFSEAVSSFSVQDRSVFLISECAYGGFYLDQLKEAVLKAGLKITVFELPEEKEGFSFDAEAAHHAFQDAGFGEEDILMSLGGIHSDAAARLFSVRYMPKIKYIKIPVTFVGQVLSASPIDVQMDMNWKAVQASYEACGGKETNILSVLRKRNPDLVYINILAYKNLSETDRISGLGEVLRIGAGFDKDLFTYVESLTGQRAEYLFTFLLNVIMNCVLYGRAHAWKDNGDTMPFPGDEIGTALEKCTNYIIPHGQAAVIGLVVASNISSKRGLLPNDDHYALAKVLASQGFVIMMNFANDLIDAICAQLPHAEESDSSETFLLPKRIGTSVFAEDVTPDEIRRAMNYRR